MGEKKWLFVKTPSGAKASAVICSIIQTAQANHLNLTNYIEYLLKMLANSGLKDESTFKKLFPWNKEIQAKFLSEKIKGVSFRLLLFLCVRDLMLTNSTWYSAVIIRQKDAEHLQ